jgi:hypothetical protein
MEGQRTVAKARKMLGKADSPYIVSLMRKIETQSKATIAQWCVSYAKAEILPIYEKYFEKDERCREALEAADQFLAGEMKLPEVKKPISLAQAAARDAEQYPAAQAAARAIGLSAAAIHTSTNALALAFYGSAAIAYDRVGIDEQLEVYEEIAASECARMEKALDKISVINEANPAKIDWHC